MFRLSLYISIKSYHFFSRKSRDRANETPATAAFVAQFHPPTHFALLFPESEGILKEKPERSGDHGRKTLSQLSSGI
jgi:hypothetical protein